MLRLLAKIPSESHLLMGSPHLQSILVQDVILVALSAETFFRPLPGAVVTSLPTQNLFQERPSRLQSKSLVIRKSRLKCSIRPIHRTTVRYLMMVRQLTSRLLFILTWSIFILPHTRHVSLQKMRLFH